MKALLDKTKLHIGITTYQFRNVTRSQRTQRGLDFAQAKVKKSKQMLTAKDTMENRGHGGQQKQSGKKANIRIK